MDKLLKTSFVISVVLMGLLITNQKANALSVTWESEANTSGYIGPGKHAVVKLPSGIEVTLSNHGRFEWLDRKKKGGGLDVVSEETKVMFSNGTIDPNPPYNSMYELTCIDTEGLLETGTGTAPISGSVYGHVAYDGSDGEWVATVGGYMSEPFLYIEGQPVSLGNFEFQPAPTPEGMPEPYLIIDWDTGTSEMLNYEYLHADNLWLEDELTGERSDIIMQSVETGSFIFQEPTGPKVIFVASVKDNDGDGIQDDQSWVDWLEAEGYYNVDARPGNWIDPLDPNKIAELEAADLIIAGRGMATGEYDGDEVAKWNALSTPILCTNAWMIRSNRWVWMNSTAANKDAGSPLMMAWVPDHPIFKGVPLDSDGLVDVLDPTVASGNTSFLNDILDVGNGTLLAQSLGIYNTTWLAEWDAGVEYYEGAGQIASGKRILFMAGTQDDPYLTESGLNQPVGVFNLNEAGQQLLRNIIKYLVPVKPVDPGTDGLVAYYAMENDVNDSSDNGLNGTILGDPNFVAGYEGMALDLDGDGDYVDCGYDPLFDVTTNEITVSAWVTIRSIANQWAAIAAKGEYAWRLGNASLDPRFHFGISIWNSPDTASIDGVAAVGYDEWHHVAGMFDGSNIMVYLDGVLDVSVATTEPIGVNDKSMLIGNNPDDPVRYWDGLIDELKIYDRALSEGELLYLAGYREPVAPVAPVHSYTFEDGTANDSVGDAHGFLVDAVVVDGAMVTTAQDQWMEMPGDMIAMNTYPEVTIEAWYTPEAGANTGWSMLGYFGDSVNDLGSNGYFMTSARGDDKSRAAISIGDEATPWASESGADGPEYDDGLLHHMVSTINATDITLYIDGVLIASTPLAEHNMISGISQNFAYLAKGGYGGDPEWIGAIDEFNIYNKALSAAQIAVNYAAGPVKPVQIAVENASFELPGTEKQNNWDGGTNDKGTFVDVPGWSSDTMATDSGVETGWNATDGEWSGFLRGSDPSAWQLTSYVIGAEDVIELKVDAKNNWQATTLLITLYYDEAGARVAAASVECALTDDIQEFSVVLSAADVPEAAGKLLGIELDNVTPDVDSWLGLDNVRIFVK